MNLLYARSGHHRPKEYQVNTYIYTEENQIKVKKCAQNDSAKLHIKQIVENRRNIASHYPDIRMPEELHVDSSCIVYKYLPIQTLEIKIENAILKKNYQKTNEYIMCLVRMMSNLGITKVSPYNSPEFLRWFDNEGKYHNGAKEDCCSLTILDLNYDNILIDQDEKLYLIDYEWVFNFPFPIKYILYRAIYHLTAKLQSLIQLSCSEEFPCYEVIDNFLIPKKWYDELQLNQVEFARALYYEQNFQNSLNKNHHDLKSNNVRNELLIHKSSPISKLRKMITAYKSYVMLEQIQQKNLSLKQKLTNIDIELKELNAAYNYKKQLCKKISNLERSVGDKEHAINMVRSAKYFKMWQIYVSVKNKLKMIREML